MRVKFTTPKRNKLSKTQQPSCIGHSQTVWNPRVFQQKFTKTSQRAHAAQFRSTKGLLVHLGRVKMHKSDHIQACFSRHQRTGKPDINRHENLAQVQG